MSTRCHIIVQDGSQEIILYRHSDGYPDGKYGMVATLAGFLPGFVEARGLHDAEYLAAQLLAFMVKDSAAHCLASHLQYYTRLEKAAGKLDAYDVARRDKLVASAGNDYLGFGICTELHSDIEYCYIISEEGVEVFETPFGAARGNWKRLSTKKDSAAIMQGKVPKKWQGKK